MFSSAALEVQSYVAMLQSPGAKKGGGGGGRPLGWFAADKSRRFGPPLIIYYTILPQGSSEDPSSDVWAVASPAATRVPVKRSHQPVLLMPLLVLLGATTLLGHAKLHIAENQNKKFVRFRLIALTREVQDWCGGFLVIKDPGSFSLSVPPSSHRGSQPQSYLLTKYGCWVSSHRFQIPARKWEEERRVQKSMCLS